MLETNSKKQQERRIFDLVYDDRSFDNVKASENPDFIVRYSPSSPYFGVEVTEYYLTETNARIDNIAGYTEELLSGKNFRHKDDVKILNVTEISLIDENDVVQAENIPAIMQEMPPPSKCAYGVAERIISKARLLKTCQQNLSHTNLIIEDKTGLLSLINKNNIYHVFFIPELIKAISAAPFREIFFITILQNEHVYMSLKMLHLITEAYLFNGVIIKNGYDKIIPPEIDYVELFAAYLDSNVISRVLIHRDADDTEVIFGDSGLLISPNNSVTIRLHLDYDIYPNSVPPNIKWQTILGDDFEEAMRDYRKSNSFSTEAVFPVNKRGIQQGQYSRSLRSG